MTVQRMIASTLALLALVGCASTTLRDSWTDPDFRGGSFRKILVVGVHPNATERRVFEDLLAEQIAATGAQAIVGYRAIPPGTKMEEQVWNAAVEASGADALMLVRLVRMDRRTSVTTTVVPAAPVYGYGWGYYNAWVAVPEVRQYDIATVETRVFDVRSRKLVWSAMTETFEPTSVAKETPGFARVILTELARRGLVPHAPA